MEQFESKAKQLDSSKKERTLYCSLHQESLDKVEEKLGLTNKAIEQLDMRLKDLEHQQQAGIEKISQQEKKLRDADLECSSRVKFSDTTDNSDLQLLQDTQQYPLRVIVTVHLTTDSSTTPDSTTRFLGCTKDNSKLDVDIPLLLPHDSRLKVSKTLECVPGNLRIADKHLSSLHQQLKKHAFKWREIGLHLGFLPGELSNIEARPNLLQGAPVSYLEALLEESIQWAPGDSRGSTSFTTLDSLKAALVDAGLGAAAHDLEIVSA